MRVDQAASNRGPGAVELRSAMGGFTEQDNAGPGRARRWRDERALEAAIYVESIPFNETRQYVKNVFANAWFYRYRLEGKPASLKQMIGTVPGRAADAAGPVASSIP